MAEAFATRFAAVRHRFGPLTWGLDPSGPLLEAWNLGDSPEGLDRFADIVLEAATGTVGLVKLQTAFYERHGWRGFRTLQRLIVEARSAGLLVIVDAKRGDVATTNEAYAEAYLGAGAPLAADALTVHPYLGIGSMDSFVPRAHESGNCLLVVTHEGPALDLVAAQGLILAPGVGAQGPTADDVARVFSACPARVMPSASRSLLVDGPQVSRLRQTAEALAREFRHALPVD